MKKLTIVLITIFTFALTGCDGETFHNDIFEDETDYSVIDETNIHSFLEDVKSGTAEFNSFKIHANTYNGSMITDHYYEIDMETFNNIYYHFERSSRTYYNGDIRHEYVEYGEENVVVHTKSYNDYNGNPPFYSEELLTSEYNDYKQIVNKSILDILLSDDVSILETTDSSISVSIKTDDHDFLEEYVRYTWFIDPSYKDAVLEFTVTIDIETMLLETVEVDLDDLTTDEYQYELLVTYTNYGDIEVELPSNVTEE